MMMGLARGCCDAALNGEIVLDHKSGRRFR